jgi:hypothetical protein
MHKKLKFVAHEMANILQNVSQNRANRKIRSSDIKCAIAAAYLSIYPGKTMYTISGRSPLEHTSSGHLYCVKGLENGNASVVWCVRWHSANDSPTPATITLGGRDSRSIVNTGSDVSASSIYPDLHIQKGQIKIIVEIAFHHYTSRGISAPKSFGFFVLNPPSKWDNIYFNTVAIFTPKPELFDEIAPI